MPLSCLPAGKILEDCKPLANIGWEVQTSAARKRTQLSTIPLGGTLFIIASGLLSKPMFIPALPAHLLKLCREKEAIKLREKSNKALCFVQQI
jgi:hypothetical protein